MKYELAYFPYDIASVFPRNKLWTNLLDLYSIR
jgi:hypothetical protein